MLGQPVCSSLFPLKDKISNPALALVGRLNQEDANISFGPTSLQTFFKRDEYSDKKEEYKKVNKFVGDLRKDLERIKASIATKNAEKPDLERKLGNEPKAQATEKKREFNLVSMAAQLTEPYDREGFREPDRQISFRYCRLRKAKI